MRKVALVMLALACASKLFILLLAVVSAKRFFCVLDISSERFFCVLDNPFFLSISTNNFIFFFFDY